MEKLTFLNDTQRIDEDAVISITVNLHEKTITDDKDNTQLKNLLDEASQHVKDSEKFDREESLALIEQIDHTRNYRVELVNNDGGLLLYITPSNAYYYHLDIDLVNQVTFRQQPNIIPLVENHQYTRDFHVLVLNQDSIRLFEKNGHRLNEIDLKERDEDAPVDQDTALGTEFEGGELNFGSAGPNIGSPGSGQVFHGHNEISQERDIDRKRYFNIVDEYIKKNYTNNTNYPLFLFGLPENQSVFRDGSQNEYLLEENVDESGASIRDAQINEKVEEKVDEIIQREYDELVKRFRETTPEYTINDILEDLSVRALEGQIEEIIIEKNYEPNGYIENDGSYQKDASRNDYICQLVRQVLNTDGSIYILPEEEMPEDTRISARLRYVKG